MRRSKPRASRPGRFTYRDGVLVHAADGRQISDAEFLAFAEEQFRRPGRHTAAATHPGAVMVRALIERHGVKPKARAIEAVQLVLWKHFPGERITKAAIERAYQKLVRGQRRSWTSDDALFMREALAILKAE